MVRNDKQDKKDKQDNMKKELYIRQRIVVILCLILLTVNMAGCGFSLFSYPDSFENYYNNHKKDEGVELSGMAESLAVIDAADETDPNYISSDYADLLINQTRLEAVESSHCFQRLYPASITKVMTALLVLEKGDLDDEITLDHDIVLNEDGAVVSSLSKGNTVTVDQVFHTMLIKSANDCAVILAEYIAGSEEKFAEMMNQRARELGATGTHFVNSNGLHDDNHYTTAYDLYLIFREATKYDVFIDTISSINYTMTYVNSSGSQVSEFMESTNHYLLKDYDLPEGVVMFGGKTGTTSMAKSCLMVMTENQKGERFYSVVLGADTKDDLYRSMSRLLEKTVN